MQKRFFFFIILTQICAHSQSLEDFGFTPKQKYISKPIKTDVVKTKDYIVIDNDTLFNQNSNKTIEDLNLFCECFKDFDQLFNYTNSVQFTHLKSKKKLVTEQWNSQITYYMDKKFPKKIRTQFRQFFEQIKNIKNFSISQTNDIDKSNFRIIISTDSVPVIKTKDSLPDYNSPYSSVTAELFKDKNHKFFGGFLKIDRELVKDEKLVLKKLKQMFFLSLGLFQINKKAPPESLLSDNYDNSNIISNYDFKILKTHYFEIYPQPLTYKHIFEFNKIAQKQCK